MHKITKLIHINYAYVTSVYTEIENYTYKATNNYVGTQKHKPSIYGFTYIYYEYIYTKTKIYI